MIDTLLFFFYIKITCHINKTKNHLFKDDGQKKSIDICTKKHDYLQL
jgi:hypothetical protein